jgi:hypothetical protein
MTTPIMHVLGSDDSFSARLPYIEDTDIDIADGDSENTNNWRNGGGGGDYPQATIMYVKL